MKEEFIKNMDDDEKLLFYGISNEKKTSKQFGRFLLGFAVLLFFWILFIPIIKKESLLNLKIFIIFITLCILTICLIYGFIYNMILKYKNKNQEYFVTNKRIAIYNKNKKLIIKNISEIERIGIQKEKDNYGDLVFNFYARNLYAQIKNGVSFEGVENPREIVGLIIDINRNIHIYDDRPIVMGR